MDDLDAVQLSTHFGTVMKIFTKIYAIAKLMHVVFLAYGVEVRSTASSMVQKDVCSGHTAHFVLIIPRNWY
jgi:hypothetical protein